MKSGGFSLVELLVVIALIGILAALASMPFAQMTRKSNIEMQVTEMYQEIVNAQRQAMQTKRRYRVRFNPNALTISRYAGDTGPAVDDPPVITKPLPVAINTSEWAAPNATDIEFNTKGIMVDPIPKSICIQSDVVPKVDSLVIVQTQISLGKIIIQGAKCGTGNINKK